MVKEWNDNRKLQNAGEQLRIEIATGANGTRQLYDAAKIQSGCLLKRNK